MGWEATDHFFRRRGVKLPAETADVATVVDNDPKRAVLSGHLQYTYVRTETAVIGLKETYSDGRVCVHKPHRRIHSNFNIKRQCQLFALKVYFRQCATSSFHLIG